MAKILLIDDDPAFRTMMRTFLEQEGHTVREAADGHEGCKAFMQTPVDLVITDIIMPGKEGIETIIALRETPWQVPIIAVSGGGHGDASSYLDLASELGADKVFSKPLHIGDLREALRDLLARKDAQA